MSTRAPVPAPWDKGLQNERTRLAATRTALSLLAAAMLMTRLLLTEHPGLALVLGTGSVAVTLVLLLSARRRYAHAQQRLHAGDPIAGAGTSGLLLAVLLVVIGIAALVWVVGRAW